MENNKLQYKKNLKDSSVTKDSPIPDGINIEKEIPGLVRSENFIPTSTKRLYFEAKLKCVENQDGFVSIGLVSEMSSSQSLPGSSSHSYGYHSNGNIFYDGAKECWNQEYSDGDVVGCYVDFENEILYFTKNGYVVNEPRINRGDSLPFSDMLYPAIGLSSNGTIVYTNFGEEEFVFDVEGIKTD